MDTRPLRHLKIMVTSRKRSRSSMVSQVHVRLCNGIERFYVSKHKAGKVLHKLQLWMFPLEVPDHTVEQ